jgi:hypothetical protein
MSGIILRPQAEGAGVYASLISGETQVFNGPIEAGGDFSSLNLNNNTVDNSDDTFGMRVIANVPQSKNGLVSVPIQGVGINPDLANMYGCPANPVSSVFGEALSEPVAIDAAALLAVPSPSYPYIPITELANGDWIAGVGYKHQGAAQDFDTANYYLADILQDLTAPSDTKPQVYSDGYLWSTITDTDETNGVETLHTGVVNVYGFVLAGKFDITGCVKTAGFAGATVNLNAGVGEIPIQIGFASGSTKVSINCFDFTLTLIDPPLISAFTYKIEVTRAGVTDVNVVAIINGIEVYNDVCPTGGSDITNLEDWFISVSLFGGGWTGTAQFKDYGHFIRYIT